MQKLDLSHAMTPLSLLSLQRGIAGEKGGEEGGGKLNFCKDILPLVAYTVLTQVVSDFV